MIVWMVLSAALCLPPQEPPAAEAQEADEEEAPEDGDSLRRDGPLALTNQYPTDHLRPLILAQPRQVLPEGRWSVRVSADWANSYGHERNLNTVDGFNFIVDAETVEARVDLRRGLGCGFEGGLALRAVGRGRGVLDGLVRGVHNGLGQTNGLRDLLGTNEYSFLIKGESLQDGTSLADPLLYARREWVRDDDSPWHVWTQLTVRIPVAQDDFGAEMGDVGLSLQASFDAGDFAFYAGLAAQEGIGNTTEPIPFRRFQGGGFVAATWNFHENWELVGQVSTTSGLLTSPDRMGRSAPYAGLGIRWHPCEDVGVEVASMENFNNLRTSADISFHFGLRWDF